MLYYAIALEELKGKTINRVFISPEDDKMVIVTTDGTFAYYTDGDCCSNSWFDSITGFDALIGSEVLNVEGIEMPEALAREYQSDKYCDVLQDYGMKITTAKGVCDIVYRNSSNGYYGGNCNKSSVPELFSEYREITDDWTAN